MNPGAHGRPGQKLDAFYPQAIRVERPPRRFCEAEGIPVVDSTRVWRDNRQDKAKIPPQFTAIRSIQFGRPGLMAFLILQGIGADGRILDLAIDAKAGKVVRSEGQTITELTTQDGLVMTAGLGFPLNQRESGRDRLRALVRQPERNMLTVTAYLPPGTS